jgi:hypothetical protein
MTLIFKHEKAPAVVLETLVELGWREFDPKTDPENAWNLFWKSSR